MGMFDLIYGHRPLPKCEFPPGTAFQTQNFDCLLGHYVIAAEERLLRCGSVDEESVDLLARSIPSTTVTSGSTEANAEVRGTNSSRGKGLERTDRSILLLHQGS